MGGAQGGGRCRRAPVLAASIAAVLLAAGPLAVSALASTATPEDSPAAESAPSATPGAPEALVNPGVPTPTPGVAAPVIVAPRLPLGDLAWPVLSVVDAAGRPVSGVLVDFTVCTQEAGQPLCATASGTLTEAERTIGADDPLLSRTVTLAAPTRVNWVSVDVTVLRLPGGLDTNRPVLQARWDERSPRWLDNDGDNDDQVLTWRLRGVLAPSATPSAEPEPTTSGEPAPTTAQPQAPVPEPTPPTAPSPGAGGPGVAPPPAVPARGPAPVPDAAPAPVPHAPVPHVTVAPVTHPGPTPTTLPAATAEASAPPARPRPAASAAPAAPPAATPGVRPTDGLEDLLSSPLTAMLGGAAVAIAVVLAAFPPEGGSPRA